MQKSGPPFLVGGEGGNFEIFNRNPDVSLQIRILRLKVRRFVEIFFIFLTDDAVINETQFFSISRTEKLYIPF